MIAKRLNIINFKNIRSAEMEFSPRLNCFVGNNGAGKTNILDALYYISMTKSAFAMADTQCVHRGDDFFLISGDYFSHDNENNLTRVVCSFKEKKIVKRDGKEYEKMRDHIGLLPVVFSTPSDVSLISDSPEERRRFINSSMSQISEQYLTALMKYNKLILERNKALKGGAKFHSYVDILDEKIPDLAEIIHSERKEYIESLSPYASQLYCDIAGNEEKVEIAYESDLNHTHMEDLLEQTREKDTFLGYTTAGIHRDDLRLTISGSPIRKFGSQGQQKTMLLALKLAQAKLYNESKKCSTMLLLDDIFDKLDTTRVENLIRIVNGIKIGQIFITDSSQLRLETILNKSGETYKLFNVSSGEISTQK